ncbi:Lateral organ boundary protein [Theobroma cacao]|nr:Lateral organ boundary protein [Theobroma cacao]
MSILKTRSNGTTQACAACKYRRRKCAPDCILAPYFPRDRQRQFLIAHKLFGVCNITKVIKDLNSPEKDIAMHTIIFQSDVRANDPVGGCYRIIQELQHQIEYSQAELDLVFHQLAICRAQAHQQQQQSHLQVQEPGDSTLGCEMVNADPLNSYNSNNYYVEEPQEQQFAVNNHHHHLMVFGAFKNPQPVNL